jgi:hypothetical protein
MKRRGRHRSPAKQRYRLRARWRPVRDPIRDKLLCEYDPERHVIRVKRGRLFFVARLPARERPEAEDSPEQT